MDGVIVIRKEKGFTSHDVVAKLRGILHMKKIGHTGTLDPDAEGVLPVALGKATRLVDMITDKEKTYEAVMRLGVVTDTQQMRFIEVDGTLVFFNEAEAVCDLDAPEPETLEATPERKKKTKGKKAQDMSELSTNRIDHYMTEEELTAEFGENGWKQLPDAIARRYRFIPAKVEVDEHHVGVYASKTDGHMVKAKHPKSLLHGSPVSASLAAAIMNGKYVNAVPLYRLEQEFSR